MLVMNKKRFLDSIVEPVTQSTYPSDWAIHQREDIVRRQEYALKMLDLQEKAGLTFKEATVFLHRDSAKLMYQLATEWQISIEGVYNLSRRAQKKIDESDLQIDDFTDKRHGFID